MCHAMTMSMALLVAAQGRPEVEVVRASEAVGWLAPTRIRLDFRDRTLPEILLGINAQGSARVQARKPYGLLRDEIAKPETPARRYSIVEPAPLPLWEAIDRVSRATGTWPEPGHAPIVAVLAPATADRGFACNEGAFRVVLTGMSYQSAFQFAPYAFNQPGFEQPRPDGSSRRPSLSAWLVILAEPRLRIVRPVELIVREAVDDRGHSLIPAVPWRQPLEKPVGRGLPNQEFVTVPLRTSDNPGKRIRHLAGSLTLEVAEDRPDATTARVAVGFDFADVPLP